MPVFSHLITPAVRLFRSGYKLLDNVLLTLIAPNHIPNSELHYMSEVWKFKFEDIQE